MRIEELQEPVAIVAEAEVPVFLLKLDDLAPLGPKLPSSPRSLSVRNCSCRTL